MDTINIKEREKFISGCPDCGRGVYSQFDDEFCDDCYAYMNDQDLFLEG